MIISHIITSIVWNYFSFEANEQATPNPCKDQTLVCRSFKKGGNIRNLNCSGAHQWTPCWAICWSTFSAKSRDIATTRKNTAENNGASTSTSKQSVRHPSENIKEVVLASKNYTANSLQAIKLNKSCYLLYSK